MRIDVTSNADVTAEAIATVAKQMPFAASKALNAVTLKAQEAERRGMEQRFTIRRKDFIEKQGVKISHFAKKTELFTQIGNDPKAAFLSKFEKGGEKTPLQAKGIAVPDASTFPRARIVAKGKRPKALNLKQHITALGKVQIKGDQRTFLLDTATGRGIFQRTGKGKRSGIRLLWWLTPEVGIKPILHLRDTVSDVASRELQPAFASAMLDAIRTARR